MNLIVNQGGLGREFICKTSKFIFPEYFLKKFLKIFRKERARDR